MGRLLDSPPNEHAPCGQIDASSLLVLRLATLLSFHHNNSKWCSPSCPRSCGGGAGEERGRAEAVASRQRVVFFHGVLCDPSPSERYSK